MNILPDLCLSYKKNEDPLIQIIKRKKRDQIRISPKGNEIMILDEGRLLFSSGKIVDMDIIQGNMLLLSAQEHCSIKIVSDATIVILRLDMNISFCNHYSFETLYEECKKTITGKYSRTIKMNKYIKNYFDSLSDYISEGLVCNYFLRIKLQEFVYILRIYYSKEELFAFFSPIITSDIHFSNLVFKYYRQVKTVKELASLLNYSLSGFEKKFKKIFQVSAYQWMQEQIIGNICYEINCTKKTFTEIAFEYGFSGPSHFNHFCKIKLGDTPGKLRRKGLSKIE